ncbi:alpha-1 3-mannosyl-glycoprotein beta-1 [Striga asiatica]|uniref:Alpha-1 3-mannosyl-glycoprotein beta-1 n=1 Tax=Striga asiatica TaxID=4170 RepID=A0A5A7PGK0_STRAF|nr:alpha-1 3-mannosyl-glycoprotein beta-1 [Striga asiatica]
MACFSRSFYPRSSVETEFLMKELLASPWLFGSAFRAVCDWENLNLRLDAKFSGRGREFISPRICRRFPFSGAGENSPLWSSLFPPEFFSSFGYARQACVYSLFEIGMEMEDKIDWAKHFISMTIYKSDFLTLLWRKDHDNGME